MPSQKVNVSEVAAELVQPFSMADLAYVGDLVLSVYICHGVIAWHKHIDQDELFWVHEGVITLESEWGSVRLRPGELAVVPKGVRHRSSAPLRSSVLLLRCGFVPERKNGQRRVFVVPGQKSLDRVNLRRAAQAAGRPFLPCLVANIEDSVVHVAWGNGTWPPVPPSPHDRLIVVLDGTATVRGTDGMLHLHPGELTVVSRRVAHQFSTSQGTILAVVTRQRPHR